LQRFKGILVSGKEGLAKPDPVIYRLLFERFQINPAEALFIDDNLRNIEASIQSGMEAKHFTTAEDLKTWMEEQKIVSKALL
jgi:2-haloacid dehalogenase